MDSDYKSEVGLAVYSSGSGFIRVPARGATGRTTSSTLRMATGSGSEPVLNAGVASFRLPAPLSSRWRRLKLPSCSVAMIVVVAMLLQWCGTPQALTTSAVAATFTLIAVSMSSYIRLYDGNGVFLRRDLRNMGPGGAAIVQPTPDNVLLALAVPASVMQWELRWTTGRWLAMSPWT